MPPPPLHSSWTNKLITAKDHGAVQINIGHVDENGVYTGAYTTLALSGPVRFRVRAKCSATRDARTGGWGVPRCSRGRAGRHAPCLIACGGEEQQCTLLTARAGRGRSLASLYVQVAPPCAQHQRPFRAADRIEALTPPPARAHDRARATQRWTRSGARPAPTPCSRQQELARTLGF